MENKPFKNFALGYNQVLDALKENTSAVNPLSVEDLYRLCPEAKNIVQVRSAVKKYIQKGVVSTMREGTFSVYWWNANDTKKPAETVKIEPVSHVIDAKPYFPAKTPVISDRPEITVSGSSVIITNSKIKITIEL